MEPWEIIMIIALIGIPFPIGLLVMFVAFARAHPLKEED